MADSPDFLRINRYDPALRSTHERIMDFKSLEETTSKQKTAEQAKRCMDCAVPFCMHGCPLGNPVPQFNHLITQDHWQKASDTLHSTNNFPEFTGAVCPAPCESSCVLALIAPPVAIKQIEKTIADEAFARGCIKPQISKYQSGKKVAVVGAGPSGLACAQQLRRAGHEVSVYDRYPEAGGLLRYGIPAYKLSKDKITRRVGLLIEEGIKFYLGVELGRNIELEELRARFDAVVLCIGAEKPRELGLAQQPKPTGVHYAMELLADGGLKIGLKDKKVIVIGGGDTGSDCIGTALRRGACKVTNLEIRSQAPQERSSNNPWPEYDYIYRISSSMAENFALGGESLYGIKTKGFTTDNRGIKKLIIVGVEQAKNSPFEFYEIENTERTLEYDFIFLALGYLGINASCLGAKPPIIEKGVLKTDAKRMTSLPGVFAAGDCRRGQSLVVWAIAEGRETAGAVNRFLGTLC